MASSLLTSIFAGLLLFIAQVRAETHTISFDNKCGYGDPQLIQGGKVLTNSSYTSNGVFSSGIAYLQTGGCGFNGEGCTLLEMTLTNPTSVAGSGSSTDISLITPHAFVVPVAFAYENGCDGQGVACNSADCSTAFFQPDDTTVQVACQADNVNLLITFCGTDSSPPQSSSTPPPAKPTTKAATSSSASPSAVVHVAHSSTVASSSLHTTQTASSTATSTTATSSPKKCQNNKRKRSQRRNLESHRKRSRSFHH